LQPASTSGESTGEAAQDPVESPENISAEEPTSALPQSNSMNSAHHSSLVETSTINLMQCDQSATPSGESTGAAAQDPVQSPDNNSEELTSAFSQFGSRNSAQHSSLVETSTNNLIQCRVSFPPIPHSLRIGNPAGQKKNPYQK
jgi:hypothetical protein